MLAVCILVAGVLQLGVQVPALYRLGFRFQYDWAASRAGMVQIGRTLTPMLFSLAVTQINTFTDSIIAWGLAAAPGGPQTIPWLGGAIRYPLHQGAAAAIYYGERMYQFPLGIVGMAVAASIFPLLSRHAAHGRRGRLGADLSLGLRLVLCLSVPAGVGLAVLAHPMAKLLFQHGQFHGRRHDRGRPHDRRLCPGRLGLLRFAGDGPRLLCPGRLRHAGPDRRRHGGLEPGLEPDAHLDAARARRGWASRPPFRPPSRC